MNNFDLKMGKRFELTPHQRTYTDNNVYKKMFKYHMSPGKSKVKAISCHYMTIKMTKNSKYWCIHKIPTEMRNNRNSHSLLVEMQNDSVTLEDKHFLTKLNLCLPRNSATALLGIYPKGIENLFPHNNLHSDVYRSFIHNS